MVRVQMCRSWLRCGRIRVDWRGLRWAVGSVERAAVRKTAAHLWLLVMTRSWWSTVDASIRVRVRHRGPV